MKNISLAIITSILLFTGCSNAKETTTTQKEVSNSVLAQKYDNIILDFTKKQISQNKRVTLKDISVTSKKVVPNVSGWTAYLLKLDLTFNGQDVSVNEIVFSDGNIIAQNLFDINSGDSLRDSVLPDVDASHYRADRLIAGTHGATNKIVVFSDPMCPFCMDIVPEVIKFVKSHEKEFALYYYHFPIETIHPQSVAIIKAAIVATKNGEKDVVERVYQSEFTPKGIDDKASLEQFNKQLKTAIKLEDIQNPEVLTHYQEDIDIASKLMISGTPTVFVNGKRDKTKEAYKGLVK